MIDPEIEFIHFDKQLSQNTGTCVIQDKNGFMWFGTRNGLNKYDGNKITIYENNPSDNTSIPGNEIKKIIEDRQGNLWILTNIGICRYNRNNNNFIRYPSNPKDEKSIPTDIVSDIFEDSDGKMWISSKYLCAYNSREDNFTRYENQHDKRIDKRSNYFNFAFETSNEYFWFICSRDIFLFDRERLEYSHIYYGGDSITLINGLQEDKKGNIWMAANSGEFYKIGMEDEKIHFKSYKKEIGLKKFHNPHLYQDTQGYLWLSSINQGQFLINPLDFTFRFFEYDPYDDYSIGSNSVWSVYEDKTGKIWFGTYKRGFYFIDPYSRKFQHFKHNKIRNSLSHHNVSSFAEDAKGNLWIGTDGGGLNYFNTETNIFTHYRLAPDSLRAKNITSLCFDDTGNLWVSIWDKGIVIFNPKTENHQYLNEINSSLKRNLIITVHNNHRGEMIIGACGSALDIYHQKSGQWSSAGNLLDNMVNRKNYCVTTIYSDIEDVLWVGTTEGLILLVKENGKYTISRHYCMDQTQGSISNNDIQSIFTDSRGYFWVGTSNGLNVLNRTTNKFKVYRKKDGLPSNSIMGILEDDSANLWISTLNGLSVFNTKAGTFRNFNSDDGIQDAEFNRNALYKTRSGKLYFGGTNGFNVISPGKVIDNPNVPQVVLTDFKIFNKSVPIGKNSPLTKQISETKAITLSHDQSVFSFEFAALNYTHPQKNQYAYMLKGFEEEWNYIGNKNFTTYTSIPKGTYTFNVKASNNDGLWNEEGASLEITILPPWWNSNMFRIFFFVLTVSAVIAVYYYRIRKIRQDNKRLEAQVEERTSEIRSKNEKLIEQTCQLNSTNILLKEKQHHIALQTDELLAQRNELIEVNNVKDKLFSIIAHDLKSPFNTLKGFTELLLLRFNNYDDSKKFELINHIYDASNNVFDLLVDILNWSRAQSGEIKLQPESTDIIRLINKNIKLIKDIAHKKEITVKTEIQETSLMVDLDVNMINAVIRNILTNALKFTRKNGRVVVSTALKDKSVVVSIKDNGVGIPDEDLQKLFKKGSHISTYGTHNEKGTGIGLIMCKDFIDLHQGNIWIESEVDKGSTISFILPQTHLATQANSGYSKN